MKVINWVAWVALLLAVGGYLFGLRRTRHNDEAERGLVVWMVLAWVAVGWLVASEIA